MRNKVFSEIYDQFTPDEAVIDELFGKLETAKPKALPFKPIMAVMGAAAVVALSFGITRLIPENPIDVAVNPGLTTTTTTTPTSETVIPDGGVTTTENEATTSHDLLITSESTPPPVAATTTTTAVTTTTTTPVVTATTTDVTTTTTTPVVTTTTTDVTTTTTTPVVTATTTDMTTTTSATTTTVITTLTPEDVTSGDEEEVEEEVEEETEEDDTEIADEDTPELKPLPELDTISEYIDLLGLGDEAYIKYESSFYVGDMKFSSFNTKEFDFEEAKAILNLAVSAQLNPDAPRKDGNKWLKNYSLDFNSSFTITFYENGTVYLSANMDSGYSGEMIFSGDTAAYEKLDAYIQALKNKTTDIPVSDETEVDEEEDE